MDGDKNYIPLTLEYGLNSVTFSDDGRKYHLKSDDDIIVYLLEDGKYQEFSPFKNIKQTVGYHSRVINNKTDKDAGDFNDLENGKIKLYIDLNEFYDKYGHILKKYQAGGKRYKKTKRKYSNKKRKSRKSKKEENIKSYFIL
jgi:hypothetical protein